MNPQLWWYVARASGIVAWVLVTASVVWGLLLSTKLLSGKPTPAWLLDLHRFLGGLAVIFTGVHLAGLVADSYVHFGPSELLVPMASEWKPGAVAWGIVAFYLLLAVELTSLAMKRLPRVWWRRIHLSSYVLFWAAAIHGATAGTDADNRAYVAFTIGSVVLVLFLTLVRLLASRRERARIPAAARVKRDADPQPV